MQPNKAIVLFCLPKSSSASHEQLGMSSERKCAFLHLEDLSKPPNALLCVLFKVFLEALLSHRTKTLKDTAERIKPDKDTNAYSFSLSTAIKASCGTSTEPN